MVFLYRGVSLEIHRRNEGRLHPKSFGPFTHNFKYGEGGLKYGSGATYGSSSINAIIRHQLNQEGFPTSGISTTPDFERAKFYARGQEGCFTGVVYKIVCVQLDAHGVKQYIVAEYKNSPSVPEDDEVILVSADFGPLPNEVIAEVIQITNT